MAGWVGAAWTAIVAQGVFLHGVNWPRIDLSRPGDVQLLGAYKGIADTTSEFVSLPSGEQLGLWVTRPPGMAAPWAADANGDDDKRDGFGGPGKPRARSVVIYFHGNGENRAWSWALRKYAFLAQNGHVVVSFDYRGFGDSTGSPTEEGLAVDARAVWDHVRRRFDGPISLYGHSLGTSVAARLAVELADPDVRVLLEAPFTTICDVVMDKVGWVMPAWLVSSLVEPQFPTISRIGSIPGPVLIMHGRADRIVPSACSPKLAAARREQAPARSTDLLMIDGGTHENLIEHSVAMRAMRRFLAGERDEE